MAFNIILQYNTSEKNAINKTLTNIATVSGVLKNATSIIDPVILIEGDLTNYVGCNYCTISVFGRYYFVNDIVSVRNGLFEIHCHCDVLSSFSSHILANKGIIYRQESNWNLYLNNGTFKVYNNPIVLTRPFPNGFNTYEFILAVAGG